MEDIRQSEGLDETPRPCDRFDLIGGTSTGGIIAIMLGRLGMTVDECIRAYDQVGEAAFTPKTRSRLSIAPPRGAYSATNLEEAIKKVVSALAPTITGPLTGYSVVLAITKDNVDAPPTLFTTYDTSAAFEGCTIWQIARATSAATTFFKPIQLGRDKIDFIDAGFGHNNPCEVLIEEAQRQYPHRKHLQVLSIGTGLGNVVSIKDSRVSILKALKKMATTSKNVATRLEDRYGGSGSYYRFNVERGLEDITLSDWQKTSNISAHTGNYLRENRRAVSAFVRRFLAEPTQEEAGVAELEPQSSSRTHYYLPLQENEYFVRRAKLLDAVHKKLFKECRREVALVGLGGAGKTQIALQFAHDVMQSRWDRSIFWISALSNESFDQSCSAIINMLRIQNGKEDPKDLLRSYFGSNETEKCLVIVDNADDGEILYGKNDSGGLYEYLSGLQHVQILFTTRSDELARKNVQREVIHVTDMEAGEATTLLKKLAVPGILLQDERQVMKLLDKLTYLPLAISQAAAYLRRNDISIARYLELLHGGEGSMVDLMSREFNDSTLHEKSQRAIATTWLVSFDQIRKTDVFAAEILAFLSCIEPKAIPESLLEGFRNHTKLETIEALGTLSAYSFVKRRADGKFLDMHSLVHLAVRIWLKESQQTKTTTQVAFEQINKEFPSDEWENRMIWRKYMPHALKILQDKSTYDTRTRHDLNYWVGRCLDSEGRYSDAITRLEEAFHWSKQHLREDDSVRLNTQHTLASACLADGQIKKAIRLLKNVVRIESILAEDDSNRLGSQHALASAYLKNGQIKDAIGLLEHVVRIQSTLAEDHPNRLSTQHQLASAYLDNRQMEDAIGLLEHVVRVRSTWAEDHPYRLSTQHQLAFAYLDNGQIKDAINLLEHVVRIKSTLAEDHPSRLVSRYELGWAYLRNGNASRAAELLEPVVAIRNRILADDDPRRLRSVELLARIHEALRDSDDTGKKKSRGHRYRRV
ncbi:hypothetical protein PFICI_07803 [Pestalotiopsis fici W106-1]|uniref:PNPLA domain-containing protein n=1 Tax=Pestalotiopsis fici (strain W106-1 / CGMCC3.15140) TaxID=1229662 RepID=W3X2P0_PESFW|nr:uncharacterized protein PFICI_07803 [Pestalotiopsis fici W106-1]ETS80274.1 hypothetical protein PFICI_07803 [Pestalotiopsis fici W106-1]